jgi:hypothetical protein
MMFTARYLRLCVCGVSLFEEEKPKGITVIPMSKADEANFLAKRQ